MSLSLSPVSLSVLTAVPVSLSLSLSLVPVCQALLSSHDSVAQLDYGPVLPPLPDEMPDDEEAMRIVCLVKNNQPLVRQSGTVLEENLFSYWSLYSFV